MSGRRIVSVHKDVSQVDDAVFAAWDRQSEGADVDLVFWNDYGLRRDRPDPELGLVPKFPAVAAEGARARRVWLDSRSHDVNALVRAVREREPSLVLLNDLAVKDKFRLAFRLRAAGFKVAFRSDKNHLSQGARRGLKRGLERLAYRLAFDLFCPVSRLAVDYYGWPGERASALFPYATDAVKFGPPGSGAIRRAMRERLDIPAAAPVLLCVAKFVEREGVEDVIRAYMTLRRRRDDARLIVVGSGPQKDMLHALAAESEAGRDIRFVGYVPYAELQDYFFAADVYVHLARCEPWGVSVTDALYAGLGVITTDAVGAGLELLTGPLARYVTPVADPVAASRALEQLLGAADIGAEFAPARAAVAAEYTDVAAARRLAALGG